MLTMVEQKFIRLKLLMICASDFDPFIPHDMRTLPHDKAESIELFLSN